jgi:lipid-binding SYLF domain-containing protein
MRARAFWIAVFGTLFLIATLARADSRQEARLLEAGQVLQELLASPDQGAPSWLLERAYAVAVVPNVIKVSLVFGGRRGKGVLVLRREDGTWSDPIFISLTGGSWGLQFGVQATDLLLVFTSRPSIEGIVGGKLTLGADASVAAGPVGRQTSAATDIGLSAQVYSYSRAKGLFAGVALDGSAVTIDHSANATYYEQPGILASEIAAKTTAPESAHKFVSIVDHATATSAAAREPAATQTPAAPPPKPATAGKLTTYPLEDTHPGAPPPQ